MGSFGVRVLFLIPTPFSLAKNHHQTNSSFTCQYPFIIAYKSGVMLDKVTKACCSRDPFLAPCMLIFVRFFTKATLKRVAVQSIF